jgi:peroxiredoxin (alkyl hydroperoxide reductase subunit C)
VATPANWQPGDDVIIPAPSSMEAVKERLGKTESGTYCLDWFICLKKDSKK